jgi:hypothetical protein
MLKRLKSPKLSRRQQKLATRLISLGHGERVPVPAEEWSSHEIRIALALAAEKELFKFAVRRPTLDNYTIRRVDRRL